MTELRRSNALIAAMKRLVASTKLHTNKLAAAQDALEKARRVFEAEVVSGGEFKFDALHCARLAEQVAREQEQLRCIAFRRDHLESVSPEVKAWLEKQLVLLTVQPDWRPAHSIAEDERAA